MKSNQLFIAVSTGLSALSVWIYILTQIPTNGTNYGVIVIFVASAVVWLALLLAGLLYWLRVRSSNREIVYAHAKTSLRQGIIIAAAIGLVGLMRVFNLIGLWELVLVAFAAVMFEIALSHTSKKTKL